MKIKAYTSRVNYSREFLADYECEKCGYVFNSWGIDDLYFYDTIMPKAICPCCRLNFYGESEEEVGIRYKL